MTEVVAKIVEATGIDLQVAQKAIGMMLGFLEREGDDAAVHKMIASVPGARELISEYGGEGSGGFLGNLVGGGIMGLGQQLMGLGRRGDRRPGRGLRAGPGTVRLKI
jgi:hypothetical protein